LLALFKSGIVVISPYGVSNQLDQRLLTELLINLIIRMKEKSTHLQGVTESTPSTYYIPVNVSNNWSSGEFRCL